jgi:peroxin-19
MASKDTKSATVDADDLADLDDILDEFNEPAAPTKPAPAAPVAAAEGSGSNKNDVADGDTDETEDEINERFARELAQGMESLMKGAGGVGGLDGLGGLPKDAAEGEEGPLMNEEEMMKQFEQMMADMGFGAGMGGEGGAGAVQGASSSSTSAPPPAANFQDAIRNTMSRLRESDQTATSSAGQASEMDFEKLMAALGNVDGAEGEEGIASMLENMMSELMSKEVLYEPLKELRDKYPAYLANPPKPLTAEEKERYQNQQRITSAVVAAFENPKFENGTEAEKKQLKSQVQDLMNEMQDSGAPPQEIVGDLPPELENMPGFGAGDENCSIM